LRQERHNHCPDADCAWDAIPADELNESLDDLNGENIEQENQKSCEQQETKGAYYAPIENLSQNIPVGTHL